MSKEIYEDKPAAMRAYLSNYGWHFNKAMQEWAASMMKDAKGVSIKAYKKDELLELLDKHGIELKTPHIYDALYVANMCKADFLGSSIEDEKHLARYVADVMSDPDGYSGMPFVRFYADTCMRKDCTIYWEDML